MHLAAGEFYPGRLAAGGRDLGYLRAVEDLAAGSRQHALQRHDDGVRAALAEYHAETLAGHGFEIGEDRAAGDIGGEVEMHAPCGERRLDVRRGEIVIEP